MTAINISVKQIIEIVALIAGVFLGIVFGIKRSKKDKNDEENP